MTMPDFTRANPPGTASERVTIQSALERQAQLLAGGHEAVNRLENRLAPVLGPHPQTNPAEGRKDPLEPVGVLEAVQYHNRILETVFERLHMLEQRAQL
jgi:hypothetical protein